MNETTVGWAPTPGDEALINGLSVRWFPAERWLVVEHVEPCGDPAWAWLTGRWVDDGGAGRVMVWLDRLLVRKARAWNVTPSDPAVPVGPVSGSGGAG